MTTIVFMQPVEGYPRAEVSAWHRLEALGAIRFEYIGKLWAVPLTNIAAIIEPSK
jgi:hypothetical protein